MLSRITKQALFFLTMVIIATAAEDAIPKPTDPIRPHTLENGGLRGARNHLRPSSTPASDDQVDDQDVILDDDDVSHYESFDELHFAKSLGMVLWDDKESPDYNRGPKTLSSESPSRSSSSDSP